MRKMGNESKTKEKNQCLPQKVYSNPRFQEELETLFDLAPSSFVKKSIRDLFFSYLCNTELENYKPEIREITTNIYLLIQFLDWQKFLKEVRFRKKYVH